MRSLIGKRPSEDPRGLAGYDEPGLLGLQAVESLGRDDEAAHPDAFARLLGSLSPKDVALLASTSGTTGKPKLAMLTHENLLAAARGLHEADRMTADDEFVSFLPLAWIGEQMLSVACGLEVGFTVNYPEEPETVRQDLVEIGPHTVFAPPRIWEDMVSEVQVRIEDSSRLKRRVYDWAAGVGEAVEELRRSRRQVPRHLSFRRFWAEYLCFFWIKDKLGLRRLCRAYTGGAALGPDVFRFFRAMGVPLKQIYGQTEVSGISVAHRAGAGPLRGRRQGGRQERNLLSGRPHVGDRDRPRDLDSGSLTRRTSSLRSRLATPGSPRSALRKIWCSLGRQD